MLAVASGLGISINSLVTLCFDQTVNLVGFGEAPALPRTYKSTVNAKQICESSSRSRKGFKAESSELGITHVMKQLMEVLMGAGILRTYFPTPGQILRHALDDRNTQVPGPQPSLMTSSLTLLLENCFSTASFV